VVRQDLRDALQAEQPPVAGPYGVPHDSMG